MKVIGLTGGIGAGKSLVLDLLRKEYGAETIQADQVARRLMERGLEGYGAVVEALGEGILSPDGEIDRKTLAARMFEDETIRKNVDRIIHPMVWKTIKDQISASQAGLIVVEFAIMGREEDVFYEELWYVRAPADLRISRLAENRGYTKKQAEEIMAGQALEEEFLARCDRVIENDGPLEELRAQLAEIVTVIKGQG